MFDKACYSKKRDQDIYNKQYTPCKCGKCEQCVQYVPCNCGHCEQCDPCDPIGKQKVIFLDKPLIKSWVFANNEVTLFSQNISVTNCNIIMVDFTVAAEFTLSGPGAYITYRLYVDDQLVEQTGTQGADGMANGSLSWGGVINKCCQTYSTIKLTAQINTAGAPGTYAVNVDPTIGNYMDAKGAYLRIIKL